MKVVLLKNIAKLGRAGEIKDVNDGYARNYLIPNGSASLVNKQDIFVLKAQAGKRERLKKEDNQKKIKAVKKVNGLSFKINAKADDTGTLYAKIDKREIAQELVRSGFQVEDNEIILSEPIKKAGKYNINLTMQNEKATIILEISSK